MTWTSQNYRGRWEDIEYFDLLDNDKNMKFNWKGLVSSKTVLFNALLTIVSIATALAGFFPSFDKYLLVAGIVGNVILKIWFNSTIIASSPTK